MTLCEVYTKYHTIRNMYNELLKWLEDTPCEYAAERWYHQLRGALAVVAEIEQLDFDEYDKLTDELSGIYYPLVRKI